MLSEGGAVVFGRARSAEPGPPLLLWTRNTAKVLIFEGFWAAFSPTRSDAHHNDSAGRPSSHALALDHSSWADLFRAHITLDFEYTSYPVITLFAEKTHKHLLAVHY